MTDLITRPAACVNPLRCALFEETTLSLNDRCCRSLLKKKLMITKR